MNNGLQLPAAGIGTYSLHGNTCFNSVYTALKNGVRLIDTAYMYGNEEEVGKAIRQAVAENNDIFDFELTEKEMLDIANLDRNEKHDWY